MKMQRGLILLMLAITLSPLIPYSTSPAQNSSTGERRFHWLTPGQSTRAEDALNLGPPVKSVSQTLIREARRRDFRRVQPPLER
jgi:hypothetical protein